MRGFWFVLAGALGSGALSIAVPKRDMMTTGPLFVGAGSVALLVESLRQGGVSWQGFGSDPWRAALLIGTAAIGFAVLVRDGSDERARALPVLALGTAFIAMIAVHLVTLAAALVALGLAVAAMAWLDGGRDAIRTASAIAGSCALGAWGLAAAGGSGSTVDAVADRWPAIGVSAAAVLLVGVCGSARWTEGWVTRSAGARVAVLGASRAVGLLLGAWAVRGTGARAFLAIAAAGLAIAAARRAATSASWQAGLSASASLALVGFGTATPGAFWGAALLAAGVGVATVLRGGGARASSVPSLGMVPLGATFAGGVTVASEALARAIVDPWWLVPASGAGLCVVWLAFAAASFHPQPGDRGVLGLAPAFAVAGVLVFIPGTVAEAIGPRFASSLSGVAPLAPVTPGVVDGLGIAFAVGALAALVAVRGRAWPTVEARDDAGPVPAGSHRLGFLPGALTAAGAVALIPLVVSGAGRGWL